MNKPPIVYRAEDVPDEFLEAIEYEMMTDEQKRIVDSCDQIAGTFPTGLTKDELVAWIIERFGLE